MTDQQIVELAQKLSAIIEPSRNLRLFIGAVQSFTGIYREPNCEDRGLKLKNLRDVVTRRQKDLNKIDQAYIDMLVD